MKRTAIACSVCALFAFSAPVRAQDADSLQQVVHDYSTVVTAAERSVISFRTLGITTDSDPIADLHREGLAALDHMRRGVANVNEVVGGQAVEQRLNLATNPWSDRSFRNFWDRVEGWGTPLGLVLAAVAVNDENNGAAALSIGAVGVVRLVGTILGSQTGERFESKARFVEWTRRAYDDLRLRYSLSEGYWKANEAFLTRLAAFREDYVAANNTETRIGVIVEANRFLHEYDAILDQIPLIHAHVKAVLDRYCPETAGQPRTCPNVGDEATGHLLGTREDVHRLDANRGPANELRQLNARMRMALMGGFAGG